jgi:uncharacterized protein YbbK (DUF523 family)
MCSNAFNIKFKITDKINSATANILQHKKKNRIRLVYLLLKKSRFCGIKFCYDQVLLNTSINFNVKL